MANKNRGWRRFAIVSSLTLGAVYVLYAAGVAIMPSSKSGRIDIDEGQSGQSDVNESIPATQSVVNVSTVDTGQVTTGVVTTIRTPTTIPAVLPSSKSFKVFPNEPKTALPGSKSGMIFENHQNILPAGGQVDWSKADSPPTGAQTTQPATQSK